jgi:serine/threonine protein kinase
MLEKLGEGAHSSVYKCKSRYTGDICAVKITRNVD